MDVNSVLNTDDAPSRKRKASDATDDEATSPASGAGSSPTRKRSRQYRLGFEHFQDAYPPPHAAGASHDGGGRTRFSPPGDFRFGEMKMIEEEGQEEMVLEIPMEEEELESPTVDISLTPLVTPLMKPGTIVAKEKNAEQTAETPVLVTPVPTSSAEGAKTLETVGEKDSARNDVAVENRGLPEEFRQPETLAQEANASMAKEVETRQDTLADGDAAVAGVHHEIGTQQWYSAVKSKHAAVERRDSELRQEKRSDENARETSMEIGIREQGGERDVETGNADAKVTPMELDIQKQGVERRVETGDAAVNQPTPSVGAEVAQVTAKSEPEAPLYQASASDTQVTGQTDPRLLQEQLRFCGSVLKQLKRLKDARPFLSPVDPVKLKIPTYYDIVKQPMDLSTIELKWRTAQYPTPQEFVNDVKLMFANCYLYNGRASVTGQSGERLEGAFERLIEKMPLQPKEPKQRKRDSMIPPPLATNTPSEPSIADTRPRREASQLALKGLLELNSPIDREGSSDSLNLASAAAPQSSASHPDLELKFCNDVLKELCKKTRATYNWPFLQPVDPDALGIPHYRTVVTHPMDLSTIRRKLETGSYADADAFAGDVRLMLRNCFVFNPVGHDIHTHGKKLEEVFERKWAAKDAVVANMVAKGEQRQAGKKVKKPQQQQQVAAAPQYQPMMQGRMSSDDESDDAVDAQQLGLLNTQLQSIMTQIGIIQDKRARKKAKRKSMSHHHQQQHAQQPQHQYHAATVSPGPSASAAGPKRRKQMKAKETFHPYKRKAATAAPRGGRKGKAKGEEGMQPLSWAEKEELSELVGELTAEKIETVMDIIRAGSGLPETSDAGEIELDIEVLDLPTQRRLFNFVKGSVAASHSAHASQPPAAKPMGLGSDSSDEGTSSDSSNSD